MRLAKFLDTALGMIRLLAMIPSLEKPFSFARAWTTNHGLAKLSARSAWSNSV